MADSKSREFEAFTKSAVAFLKSPEMKRLSDGIVKAGVSLAQQLQKAMRS